MKFSPVTPSPAVDIRDIQVFRTDNFPPSNQLPWLDRPNWRAQVESLLQRGEITAEQAELCRHWAENGYVIMPKMFSDAVLDTAWRRYESLIAQQGLVPVEDYDPSSENTLPGRVLNPHFKVPEFDAILRDTAAADMVSLLLGVTSLPFQTIAGHKGSQQLAHSDSIHMTTYPQGYLVANWIAFEDIAPDSGPLEFYPGSHRLPYVYARECGIGLDEGRASYMSYHTKYESRVQRDIAENGLAPSYFHANKGDVFFWHANLLHGGSRIKNMRSSRRALVCHYFAEGCVCYHDYTGSPNHLLEFPLLQRTQFNAADYLRLNPDVAAAGADAYTHYLEFGFREKRRVR